MKVEKSQVVLSKSKKKINLSGEIMISTSVMNFNNPSPVVFHPILFILTYNAKFHPLPFTSAAIVLFHFLLT